MTIEEVKAMYPIGFEFTDQFGQPCIVIGHRTNPRGGVQIVANVKHTWPDGYFEWNRQAYYPGVLPKS
jgi:hypothetical protein